MRNFNSKESEGMKEYVMKEIVQTLKECWERDSRSCKETGLEYSFALHIFQVTTSPCDNRIEAYLILHRYFKELETNAYGEYFVVRISHHEDKHKISLHLIHGISMNVEQPETWTNPFYGFSYFESVHNPSRINRVRSLFNIGEKHIEERVIGSDAYEKKESAEKIIQAINGTLVSFLGHPVFSGIANMNFLTPHTRMWLDLRHLLPRETIDNPNAAKDGVLGEQ